MSGKAKLTQEQVNAIRKRYVRGGITQRFLGDLYAVNGSTIIDIVNHKTWRIKPE